MTDIFNGAPVVTAETLVGEDKPYKTFDDLARGKLEADRTIKAREEELAGLREELQRRLTFEQLAEELKRRDEPSPFDNQAPRVPPVNEPQNTPAPSLTDEDLENRIAETLQRQREQERIAANVNEVTTRLIQTFGDEAKAEQYIQQKAAELGVSTSFLRDAAARSPKAFFVTIGLEGNQTPAAASHTKSDVNTAALVNQGSGPKPGSYEFYENLRKTDPSRYWDPKTQRQLHKDATQAIMAGQRWGS